MRSSHYHFLPCLFAIFSTCTHAASGDSFYKDRIFPFLEENCLDCHDDETTKGDLNLYDLSYDIDKPINFEKWAYLYERVKLKEMPPPKKKKQPSDQVRTAFSNSLQSSLFEMDHQKVKATGRTSSRRLTRSEYENTVRDLLGIGIPFQRILPEDPLKDGFEKVATVQQLSHFTLEQYLRAANNALSEAFSIALTPPKTFKRTTSVNNIKNGQTNSRGPIRLGNKLVSYNINGPYYGRIEPLTAPVDGWYKIRIENVTAVNIPDYPKTIWSTVRSGALRSNDPQIDWIGSIEAVKTPRTYEFKAWMNKDDLIEIRPNDKTLTGVGAANNRMDSRDPAGKKIPGIAFSSASIERIFPFGEQAHVQTKLFGDIPVSKGQLSTNSPLSDCRKIIRRFAYRAFRRPVTDEQIEPYFNLAEDHWHNTKNLNESLRVSLRAILCSPRFLFINEAVGPLDDYSIATRLSYLLWNTTPDHKLLEAAEKGMLSNHKKRAEHVKRMLDSHKSDAFIAAFTDQWLNLRDIDFTTPDRRLFPKFDPVLQQSMLEETRAFIKRLIKEDMSVSNLIHSDFAMLNTRLARHYRLKLDRDNSPKATIGLMPINLPENSNRGGIVTQGAVLKVSADGSNTSPVVRGMWINERILGVHIPPPPANVPAVEPDIRGATTIRERLDKHRSEERCASCHIKIDPPGFALENYNPVGVWRTHYPPPINKSKKSVHGLPVNPSYTYPDGVHINNINDWKSKCLEKPEQLARSFAQKIATYSTGATPRFSDHVIIDEIVAESKESGYGLKTILHAVINSPLFLNK